MPEFAEKKICILVTGLPRSGTSSVAQMLDNLGVHFGDPAHFLDTSVHKHNPVFYELQWINDYNDKIIAALGSSYFEDFFPVDSDFDSDAMRLLEPQLGEAIANEFGNRKLIGVKDPRLCFTLPLWRRVLGAAGYDVKVALTLRSPAALIKSNSLLRDDRPCQWHRFYVRHLLCLNYLARDMSLTQVDFDSLMREPQPTALAAASALDLPVPDPVFAVKHLNAQHYHHKPQETETGEPWVDQVDADLRNGRLEPERYLVFRGIASLYADDQRDTRARERATVDARVAQVITEKDDHIAKLEAAHRQAAEETLRELRAKDRAILDTIEAKDRQTAEIIALKDRHIAEIIAAKDQYANDVIQAKDQYIESLTSQSQAVAAELQSQLDAVHRALEQRGLELAELNAQLSAKHAEAVAHQSQIQTSAAEIARFGTELESARTNAGLLRTENDGLLMQIKYLQARSAELDQELSRLYGRPLVRLAGLIDPASRRRSTPVSNESST